MPSLGQLASLWRNLCCSLPKTWSQVTSPFGAMWLSLIRLGWSMPDPFTLLDDRGIPLQLLETSPKLVCAHLREAWLRKLAKSAASSI
eukprot:2909313-Heterocapsa_arctica.AAC.1